MSDLVSKPLKLLGAPITLLGSLFKSDKPPAPPPVTPMPDPADTAEAKKRQAAAMLGRSGRQSTILTDPSSDKLGG